MMYKKLLFVDDQSDVLLVLEREFCRCVDIILFSARDKAQAMKILAREDIDVMVCDIKLGPEESGYELARFVREHYPKTGIIMISGWMVGGNAHKAQLLDLIFLPKPFKLQDLHDLVDTFFPDAGGSHSREYRGEDSLTEQRSMTHFQPQDLVQLFCLNGKCMLLSIQQESDHDPGRVFIQKGQVVHAEYGTLWGEDAFHALMHLAGPQINIKTLEYEVEPTIKTTWERLLLSSAVRKDEEGLWASVQGGLDTDYLERRVSENE